VTTAKKLRSPIQWVGGKGLMVTKLLSLVPPHKIYVEVFGGGASLLFGKTPSPVEVYNDLDSGLVNFFRVLRDPEMFAKFHSLVSLTPYSREEYNLCRASWEECDDEIIRAYRWFVVARMSFGGHFAHSWGNVVTTSCRGMASTCSQWLSTIDMLPLIHERLMRVQIENADFRNILTRYDTPDALIYCDPPYVPDTRRDGRYKHEMSLQDHSELVEILLKVKAMVILSGYRHSIHTQLEQAGWERKDYETSCHAAARTRASGILGNGSGKRMQPRVESVWINPQAQKAMPKEM